MGYSNNTYLCTSCSITTGTIYFRNQILSPYRYKDFASFSQTGTTINFILTLNNALTCTNISTTSLFLNTTTLNSGIIFQSTTSANMLCIVSYTGGGSYNPTTQNGDTLFVIGNTSGTIDSGKVLNIIPHSSTLSGLQMDGVNNTFSGSLIVTSNLSTASITTTNITCPNLY